jgi:hypothetical protein
MKSTASKQSVSLIDVSAYLPESRVPAEYYANFAGTDDLRGEEKNRYRNASNVPSPVSGSVAVA